MTSCGVTCTDTRVRTLRAYTILTEPERLLELWLRSAPTNGAVTDVPER